VIDREQKSSVDHLERTRMSIKILVTGDNHLDNPSAQYGAKKQMRQKDFKDNFETIIDYAIENRIDLFLVCGDLFHNCRPSNTTRAWVMHQFRRLTNGGTSVFVITGHHDTPKSILSGVSPLKTHGESGHITYLENPSSPEAVDIEVKETKIRIVGVGFNPMLRVDDDPLAIQIPPPSGDINILMLHYPIIGFSGFIGDESKIRPESLPDDYSLIVAGHFHTAQKKKIGSSLVVIPGSSERINFNEEESEKSFSIVTIGKDMKMEVEQIPLQCREMKTITIKVKDGDDINSVIESEIIANEDSNLILRIRVEGSITAETLATYRRSPLQRKGDELCFKLLLEDTDSLRVKGLRDIEPTPSINPDEELLSYFDLRAEEEESRQIVEKAKEKCIQLLEEVASD
jgi:DNA repair exonuclease SbcCD nuclease subunit